MVGSIDWLGIQKIILFLSGLFGGVAFIGILDGLFGPWPQDECDQQMVICGLIFVICAIIFVITLIRGGFTNLMYG